MGHFVEVTHYGVTSDIFANHKTEWFCCLLPLFGGQYTVQANIGGYFVGHLYADGFLTRYWRFNAQRLTA
jgi:hypothetical protein